MGDGGGSTPDFSFLPRLTLFSKEEAGGGFFTPNLHLLSKLKFSVC